MRLNRFSWFLGLLAAGLACADQVDGIIKSAIAEQHIPGLALAVMKDGKMIRRAGQGLANVELSVPVTVDTVFKIGSISKQFIASGVMILAQEHKLQVGDSVRKFLDDAPGVWSDITLRRLLSHTSGLLRAKDLPSSHSKGSRPFR
jgi:CubicO group peptidase (beta-lactamase class C family)